MTRLWMVFFVLWYRTFTIAKSETVTAKDLNYEFQQQQQQHNDNNAIIPEDKLASNPNGIEEIDNAKFQNLPNTNSIESLIDYCATRYLVEKRKFNAWGGKRSTPYDDFERQLYDCLYADYSIDADGDYSEKMLFKRTPYGDADAPKRLPFKAWGGKRAPEQLLYAPAPPYAPTYGGGQSPVDEKKTVNRKKTKFHSWGGKRADGGAGGGGGVGNGGTVDAAHPGRRLKFNSWGGKRAYGGDEVEYDDEDKRSFHSWGGKRTFHSWGG